MNEGSSKVTDSLGDIRLRYGLNTAQIRRRYGSGREEAGLCYSDTYRLQPFTCHLCHELCYYSKMT
jgi:hypothetical protein